MAAYYVFGSNIKGIHSKGCAKVARVKHGALEGVGEGFNGRSYAIPVRDAQIRLRPLYDIMVSVEKFLNIARRRDGDVFIINEMACGNGEHDVYNVASLFRNAPDNCILPEGWEDYYE